MAFFLFQVTQKYTVSLKQKEEWNIYPKYVF